MKGIDKRQAPVKIGSTYTVTIGGLGSSGEGVGKIDGFTVFVPRALPGETVKVKITTLKASYAVASLLTVMQPSPDRIEARCPIYEACGGCQFQHLAYQAQLEAKRQTVVDAVHRIGKLTDVVVKPVIGMTEPWYYRNKMQFPVAEQNGRAVIGCYAQGTHAVVDTEHCFIQDQANNRIVSVVRQLLDQLKIPPYNEKTGQGVIRHVLGRVGRLTGEVMVVLVTATRELPKAKEMVSGLRQAIPNLVSIVHNINSRVTNVILGPKTQTLWGADYITDRLGPFVFKISAHSFFQVNTEQAEHLYNVAVKYAGLTGKETVIDAYCGTGTISLFLAQQAKKVIGIEVVGQAIDDANKNAVINDVHNVEFITGDAVIVMPELHKKGIVPDVIVVDPPRAGCDRKILETVAAMSPGRIVYVSCNPASLARDLAILRDVGYISQEIQPVDMFGMTSHVECVALIERK